MAAPGRVEPTDFRRRTAGVHQVANRWVRTAASSDRGHVEPDGALREGRLDGACGVAGAEGVGTGRIWIIKRVDPGRPVRLGGRMPAQAHERRDFDPGRSKQILEGIGIRQPQRHAKRRARAPLPRPAPPWPRQSPPPTRRQRSLQRGRRARAARRSGSRWRRGHRARGRWLPRPRGPCRGRPAARTAGRATAASHAARDAPRARDPGASARRRADDGARQPLRRLSAGSTSA